MLPLGSTAGGPGGAAGTRGGRARCGRDARCGEWTRERAAWCSREPTRLGPGAAGGCRRGPRLLPSFPAGLGIFMVIGAGAGREGAGVAGDRGHCRSSDATVRGTHSPAPGHGEHLVMEPSCGGDPRASTQSCPDCHGASVLPFSPLPACPVWLPSALSARVCWC